MTFKDFCSCAALVLFAAGLTAMSALPLAVTLPPPRYDHEPTVKYKVVEVHWSEVHKMCFGHHPGVKGGRALACSRNFGQGLGWTIIMPKRDGSLLAADWKLTLRHEKAHVNGWPRHHPNARICGNVACSWLYPVGRGEK